MTSSTPILITPTFYATPAKLPAATQTGLSNLLDRIPLQPEQTKPADLAIDLYHMHQPIFPEQTGFSQVQTFLGKDSRWGEPGVKLWREQERVFANNELAPFGYHLEGSYQPPSPVPFKLFFKDRVVLDNIEWFFPVSVNQSKTDFMMVAVTNQGTKLVRSYTVQEWKDLSLWIHATCPQFLGDDVMYADMELGSDPHITVRVFLNDQQIYKTALSEKQESQSPLIGFWTYGRHWVLELKNNIIIDGQSVNQYQEYQKSYEFHLLGGKPLYFFEKDGEVNLNYDEQEIILNGYLIPHGNCCSDAELNPRQRNNLLVFFLNKSQQWYYVEIEPE